MALAPTLTITRLNTHNLKEREPSLKKAVAMALKLLYARFYACHPELLVNPDMPQPLRWDGETAGFLGSLKINVHTKKAGVTVKLDGFRCDIYTIADSAGDLTPFAWPYHLVAIPFYGPVECPPPYPGTDGYWYELLPNSHRQVVRTFREEL